MEVIILSTKRFDFIDVWGILYFF